jgi:hypothetical protein
MPAASDSPRTSSVTRGEFGKVQGRLPGGVRPTDDVDSLAGHRRCLSACRAVEDASPDETLESRDADAAVGHAGGDDHRTSVYLAPAGECDYALFTRRS